MNRLLTLSCLAALFGLAGAAQAANFTRGAYDGAKTDIKATYKAERDKCGALTGNAREICVEQAKGREAVALAQLEYNYTGSARDETRLLEAQYKARYELAKERCDDLAGDAKALCVREAKTARDKEQADVKLAKRVTVAVEDAESARAKAEYKLAMEKCSQMTGDTKDTCIVATKARYGERW
ncbi:hypothetical protein HLB44_14170 [Aquincola sp. S2]|uniref:DUF1311 domain-containing protein n=1 Tax=Pseudaquabacterium terrae TaxID=2732868 RepID=A0ABX2EHN4_9BURK|nr:hypothetical protein [Aquabacterium terrae]NRF68135.1 hypothetical protein [Aquabacterium terrae]